MGVSEDGWIDCENEGKLTNKLMVFYTILISGLLQTHHVFIVFNKLGAEIAPKGGIGKKPNQLIQDNKAYNQIPTFLLSADVGRVPDIINPARVWDMSSDSRGPHHRNICLRKWPVDMELKSQVKGPPPGLSAFQQPHCEYKS